MIAPGAVIATTSGSRYEVVRFLAEGGQGEAHELREPHTGSRSVLKLFDPDLVTTHPQVVERTDRLVRLALWKRHPGLAGAPRELIAGAHQGYVSSFVPGSSLADVFGLCTADRMTGIAVGIALSSALHALECAGLAHGDLSPANIFVDVDAQGVPRVALIDFDNVRMPGPDEPPVIGTPLYMAPELYDGSVRPNLESDRFALTVLLHHILFGRHPAEAFMRPGATTVSQAAVMGRNDWVHADEHERASGLSAETISARLRRMLRRGLARDPGVRTRANEWQRELRRALDDLWECPRCEIATVNDELRTSCPNCGEPGPARMLVLDDGRSVRLEPPATRLGRPLLGAADVSHEHAVFEWRGYELTIRNLSRNGTWIATRKGWRAFPHDQPIEIRPGDRLRFGATVAGRVAQVPANDLRPPSAFATTAST